MEMGGRTHGFFSARVVDSTATSARSVCSIAPSNLAICTGSGERPQQKWYVH